MKYITICLSALFISISSLYAENKVEKPLSVVVIGAGPAGLATAIEAHENGAAVTIVEKRDAYTRLQVLFLIDKSLSLLNKWEVALPQMHVAEVGEGTKIGLVAINQLEEKLDQRVKELGIKKIHGTFKRFSPHEKAAVITTNGSDKTLPYDILIGADGAHSKVRKALGISTKNMGSAKGFSTIIPLDPKDSEDLDVSPPIKKGDLFIRRITFPGASIIFSQSPKKSNSQELMKATEDCGWKKEADLLAKGQGWFIEVPEITLQQAKAFSDKKNSAILVGEAAATASFFKGMGANTALKTAELAGKFFSQFKGKETEAYDVFNQAMLETTDALIEDSRFLFP